MPIRKMSPNITDRMIKTVKAITEKDNNTILPVANDPYAFNELVKFANLLAEEDQKKSEKTLEDDLMDFLERNKMEFTVPPTIVFQELMEFLRANTDELYQMKEEEVIEAVLSEFKSIERRLGKKIKGKASRLQAMRGTK